MKNCTKPGATSQVLFKDRTELRKALLQENYAASMRKIYLCAFDKFATRLDRKTPATATLKEAKRHLTELKQTKASAPVYGNASAMLRFYFERVKRPLCGAPLSRHASA